MSQLAPPRISYLCREQVYQTCGQAQIWSKTALLGVCLFYGVFDVVRVEIFVLGEVSGVAAGCPIY